MGVRNNKEKNVGIKNCEIQENRNSKNQQTQFYLRWNLSETKVDCEFYYGSEKEKVDEYTKLFRHVG